MQCKLYVCNTFYDAAYVLPLVCVGMVGNDGGLFTHHHSQFYGLAFYFGPDTDTTDPNVHVHVHCHAEINCVLCIKCIIEHHF